ncbi:sulfotransferase 6B1 [Solea senegalensis]|uniref:Sulfotransferase n=2 Tax=Solea senegalensis TaxID=28829 RepID=A0AAV6PR33_SOLSE|nr:sulfotransferase 6B1 [Solea senegalensis]KAG7471713.1 sulfotransferase 6B1 [Solea senegalensis]
MSSSSSSSSSSSFHTALQARMEKVKEMSEEEKLYRYNGVLYPTLLCPEEHLKALEKMEAREDDVLLVAYPKCGFNWMVGVMKRIIAEATGTKSETKTPPLLEFSAPDCMKLMDEMPSPRLLGTHLHPDNIPNSFKEKKTKMLVVFRNPKDTLVSFFHFTNNNPVLPSGQSWESFYSHFLNGDVPWGSYFEHALAWEKRMNDPNVMVVTYEELKQDLSDNIRQISRFFGFSLTEAQVQQVAEQSTFTAMKEHATNSHGNIGKVIFRKGEVGDWRNHFTPEQSRDMDQVFDKHLGGTRLGVRLNYQLHCQEDARTEKRE